MRTGIRQTLPSAAESGLNLEPEFHVPGGNHRPWHSVCTRGPHTFPVLGSPDQYKTPEGFSPLLCCFISHPLPLAHPTASTSTCSIISYFIFLQLLKGTAFSLSHFLALLLYFNSQGNHTIKWTRECTQFWSGLLKASES